MESKSVVMEEREQIPRLTRSLRALQVWKARDVSNQHNQIEQYTMIYQGLNWETIKVVLDTQKSQIIDQIKKKLHIIYMDLVGEESKAVLDDTAAYLFKIFLDEKMVLQKHINQIKQLYGTINTFQIHEIFRVLIATATLAWDVNFPAHLVVVKGTEYYDGKLKRFVDMPITDVLQMMGRAGRPQYDERGVAVVFVHDGKKNFYKKFMYEPFPVESSLLDVLPDHLNAEIVK